MPISTDKIASWEETGPVSDAPFVRLDSIDTEAQPSESPEWNKCLDALLQTLYAPSAIGDPPPNRSAIEAAIAWLNFLRKQAPWEPPTCIVPEPAGGVIVERRATLPDGREWVWELTFYNTANAERTDYVDGRVLQIVPIPQRPQAAGA